jgi:hypothetical protein
MRYLPLLWANLKLPPVKRSDDQQHPHSEPQ